MKSKQTTQVSSHVSIQDITIMLSHSTPVSTVTKYTYTYHEVREIAINTAHTACFRVCRRVGAGPNVSTFQQQSLLKCGTAAVTASKFNIINVWSERGGQQMPLTQLQEIREYMHYGHISIICSSVNFTSSF